MYQLQNCFENEKNMSSLSDNYKLNKKLNNMFNEYMITKPHGFSLQNNIVLIAY